MTNTPYDFGQAVAAAHRAAAGQIAAEKFLREASQDYAECEEAYRVALAKRIVELHAEGTAWTACQDIARGDEQVAKLRRLRDIAEGVREAAAQASWRRAADRKDVGRFTDWSMRRDLAEGNGPLGEPDDSTSVIGGKRAA